MDGIIPGIITAEAGLLINILTNYVSLGTQNREGAKTKDWLEEIILSILRSGNYTHKEIARRTQVRTDKVLECLKRLQQANRVEAVGQIGHDEIIWSRLGG